MDVGKLAFETAPSGLPEKFAKEGWPLRVSRTVAWVNCDLEFVNKKTGIKARTTTTWSVTFRSGPVRYRSDASKKLHGSFSVLASG